MRAPSTLRSLSWYAARSGVWMATQGSSTHAARDTIAAVFREHGYDRTAMQSLWDRLWQVLFEWLRRVFRAVDTSSVSRPIVVTLLVIVVALILARVTVLLATHRFVYGRRAAGFTPFGRRTDPWVEAQRLATAGRYTDAAHALYAALLEGVALREELRLHPSKTVGDYARELRRRSSALVPRFRDFARLYEVVVYGIGVCDRARYERLYALATGMLVPPS